ncbi:hypothetical protein B0H13DRAFT_1879036 [Mycena leptocephala]|nr:hypothetical protein B0H13DRAFT_1879036 [Mycena leptocephala]
MAEGAVVVTICSAEPGAHLGDDNRLDLQERSVSSDLFPLCKPDPPCSAAEECAYQGTGSLQLENVLGCAGYRLRQPKPPLKIVRERTGYDAEESVGLGPLNACVHCPVREERYAESTGEGLDRRATETGVGNMYGLEGRKGGMWGPEEHCVVARLQRNVRLSVWWDRHIRMRMRGVACSNVGGVRRCDWAQVEEGTPAREEGSGVAVSTAGSNFSSMISDYTRTIRVLDWIF